MFFRKDRGKLGVLPKGYGYSYWDKRTKTVACHPRPIAFLIRIARMDWYRQEMVSLARKKGLLELLKHL